MSSSIPLMRMPARHVKVKTPSRLHFGLFSFGNASGRQFGGVGVMIEEPSIHICITPNDRLEVVGCCQSRAEEAVRRWCQSNSNPQPNCRLELLTAPPLHCGLGVGTQLALGVATALNAAFSIAQPSTEVLAASVQRGRRSAVGSYGFTLGGLIVDDGKAADRPLANMRCQVALPQHWRFVLITPRGRSGLSGRREEEAFSQLPAVPESVTNQLRAEVEDHMLPAAREERFEEFAESVTRYGESAGSCFASIQGGIYSSPQAELVVERLKAVGAKGLGQSSWGPTLFALMPNQSKAESLVQEIVTWPEVQQAEIRITPPSRGAHSSPMASRS